MGGSATGSATELQTAPFIRGTWLKESIRLWCSVDYLTLACLAVSGNDLTLLVQAEAPMSIIKGSTCLASLHLVNTSFI